MADMTKLVELLQEDGLNPVVHLQGFDLVGSEAGTGTTVKVGATGSVYVTHFKAREETWSAVFSSEAPLSTIYSAVVNP
jgi:hypothetical protein